MNNPTITQSVPITSKLDDARNDELRIFIDKLNSPHIQVSPCFMTGRACVYSENIEGKRRNFDSERKVYEGFVIMPFRPNINLYHNNCFKPFVEENYIKKVTDNNQKIVLEKQVTISTASQVRRPGVIICEGICKKIQESDFIVADLSLPNSNVFYELGLAYGLNQKIIAIYKDDIENSYKEELKAILTGLNCNESFCYEDLNPLTIDPVIDAGFKPLKLSTKIWQRIKDKKSIRPVPKWKEEGSVRKKGLIIFYSQKKKKSNSTDKPSDDINIAFEEHVPSAIGISIADIYKTIKDKEVYNKVAENIESLKNTISFKEENDFKDFNKICSSIDDSYCFVVRTGGEDCHPMAYFWLGYCHAIGKNVIPITVVDDSKSRVDDLAFDIRAHRHITFINERPELFTDEIKETLRLMIESDFRDLYRKRFWNGIIGKGGEISIFTGALHSNSRNREMIGDWDLLSVSELTSYFGRNQFRFKIEAPIYPPETAFKGYKNEQKLSPEIGSKDDFKASYINQLQTKLENKNCIIIASPDVNPLTEIIFGKVFGLDKSYSEYFNNINCLGSIIDKTVCIPFKSKKEDPESNKDESVFGRTFYWEQILENDANLNKKPETTGIRIVRANQNKNGIETSGDFTSKKPTVEPDPKLSNPVVYGHLFVARNPFGSDKEKFIIILNGVGGPATFALSHVITGGVIEEFTVYNEVDSSSTKESKQELFNPETTSESILEKISDIFNKQNSSFIEAIIEVHIKNASSSVSNKGKLDLSKDLRISDWRRITKWQLVSKAFDGKETRCI
jgi:nucleoside 2-deoxyribosyltransferase